MAETCRAILQLPINILLDCIKLVFFIYIYILTLLSSTSNVKGKNLPHKTGLKKFNFVINLEQRGVDSIQKKLFDPASLRKGVAGCHSSPDIRMLIQGLGEHSQYSVSLRAGRSGDWIPVQVRFSVPVQTSPGAHPAYYTMCTGSLSQGWRGRGMAFTTHTHSAPWLRMSRAIPLLPLWVFMAC